MIKRILFGSLLIPMGILGVVCNWSVVFLIRKLPVLKHSFGLLTANQAFSDALHGTAFLFYVCPMIIFDIQILKDYSYHCGYILIFCYELSVLSHFFISCNRFAAIHTPLKYNIWFSMKNTKISIFLMWSTTIGFTVLFYQIWCRLYFDINTLMFVFEQTQFCTTMSWYTDFWKFIIFITLVAVLDIITVMGVHKINTKVHNPHDQVLSKKKRQREMNFLKQTCCQGVVFVFELVSYFVCPLFISEPTLLFFLTSFSWVSVHALDGFITVMCNPEFNKILRATVKGESMSSSLQIAHNTTARDMSSGGYY